MDNPYQPPTSPLMAGISDEPAEQAVIIDSPKGPVRLERRGETITLVFDNVGRDFPAAQFVSSILLHTTRVPRISFKPIGLYLVVVSEGKFREVLDFYGIERFKYHDLKSMRVNNGVMGVIFIALATLTATDAWSLYDLGLICVGIMNFALFALTFTRLYLTYWAIVVFTHLTLGATMALLWYSDGAWWVFVVLIFFVFALWASLGRLHYFSRSATR